MARRPSSRSGTSRKMLTHDYRMCGLQIMHKAPLTETKQVEHVVNERRILGMATHPFCVCLHRAFQDTKELYLLQEWVGGAPCPQPLVA